MSERYPAPWAVEDIGGCFVVKASNDRPLVFIYYGEGVACRYCQAARAIAEGLICLTKIKVFPSRQPLSFFGGN